MVEVLALIPARGGSKGIPRKNIKDLGGYPLIAYSIAAGLNSKLVTRTIVTTDDGEIARIAREYGAEVPFLRPEEIARDAEKVYRLGASVLHLHARDRQGQPTYRIEVYREIVNRVLDRCPDVILCLSTSGRIHPQVEHRREVLALEPEMASLTVGSLNFPHYPSVNAPDTIRRLLEAMYRYRVLPELEVFEPGFINYTLFLHHRGILQEPLHYNLLLGSLGSCPARMRDLTYLVDSLPEGSSWSATGIGRFQTPINVGAILMGGHVRVGIEDSIYYHYPDKKLATNEQLVARIVRLAHELGRDIATPDEARVLLGLPLDR